MPKMEVTRVIEVVDPRHDPEDGLLVVIEEKTMAEVQPDGSWWCQIPKVSHSAAGAKIRVSFRINWDA